MPDGTTLWTLTMKAPEVIQEALLKTATRITPMETTMAVIGRTPLDNNVKTTINCWSRLGLVRMSLSRSKLKTWAIWTREWMAVDPVLHFQIKRWKALLNINKVPLQLTSAPKAFSDIESRFARWRPQATLRMINRELASIQFWATMKTFKWWILRRSLKASARSLRSPSRS